MSHDDIWSLFVHQNSKPDVLPSPARAPSVPRISRIFSWGSFLARNVIILKTVRTFEVSKQGSGRDNSSLKYRQHLEAKNKLWNAVVSPVAC